MKKLLLSFLFFVCFIPAFSQFTSEGFENTTGVSGPLPATWRLGSGDWGVFENNTPANTATTESWGIHSFTAGLQFEGNNCASVNTELMTAGGTSRDYLVTPMISVPFGTTQLHFYTRLFTPGDQGTTFKVMIAPADFAPQLDALSYSDLVSWTESDLIVPAFNYDVWTEKTVDLTPYVGFNVFVAFVRVYTQPTTNVDGDRWLIDNVSISNFNPCIYSISAEYLSPTTVEVRWNTNNPHPVEVMILPCDTAPPTPTDSGVIVNSNSYQFTNLIPNSCYKVYIKNACPESNTWFSMPVYYHLPRFHLVAFYDTNNNGIKDSNEINFQRGRFAVSKNNSLNSYIYAYNGEYSITPTQLTDVFDFDFLVDPVAQPCVTLGSFNYNDIPVSDQPQTIYFPVIPIASCFDNSVILSGRIFARAGFSDGDYLSIFANSISSPSSGTLTYTKAPNTTITAVYPSYGVVLTPTGFTYNYSGLTINQRISLYVGYSIPPIPNVNFGEVLLSSASISFSPADSNPSNDISSLSKRVVASYDPNDISESHGPQIQFNQFGSNDYLYYTIRFQNTGNANAIKVRVDDILDSKLDESTISMIAASHDYIMVTKDNTLTWEFNNIQLPPASVDEALSNGFITFKIKPKPGYAIGDIIPATASIYFDSNPAIVTNTFNTEFVQALSNATFTTDSISMYPNPASNLVTISNTDSIEKISSVLIYEISGKRIYSSKNESLTNFSIDVSHFSKGIYLVDLLSENNSKVTKKLIIQ